MHKEGKECEWGCERNRRVKVFRWEDSEEGAIFFGSEKVNNMTGGSNFKVSTNGRT